MYLLDLGTGLLVSCNSTRQRWWCRGCAMPLRAVRRLLTGFKVWITSSKDSD